MDDLTGKVVIVTGAGRGIGRTIAQTLAMEGMKVAINDINPATVQNVVDELNSQGCQTIPFVASVTDEVQVESMFEQVEAELGPLWLLVNNAGVLNAAPTAEMSVEMWDTAFEVDAKGVFLCSRAAIRRMIPRGQGRIVNFGSIAGHIVRTGQIAYCAAKAAVIHFTRCLAVEVAPHGITVNCLCPGMTWTDMLSVSAQERSLNLDAMIEMIPDGHMAQERDHANLVVFFAGESSAHITGQVIDVDGAQSLFHPLEMKHG
jgi:NAD(P)-dependent dehydrogenase (short-subunit alcohol dehydrogenase family)